MNEKQKRILVSLVAGSALSLALGLTAHAEDTDPTPAPSTSQTDTAPSDESVTTTSTVDEPPAGESDETTTEESTKTSTEESTETSTEESTKTSTEEPTETSTEESTKTSSGSSGQTTTEGSEGSEAQGPVVTVGGYDLADEANASVGWVAGEQSGSGWRYDGTSVSMVNNGNAVEVHAEGAGVNLSVAGFNRISTLYADGDVNITGTGIVLIDSINMLEGTNLNLLTNTDVYADGEGSAAVFLKNEAGEYVLINGSVAGILDETYTIPEGVTLILPDGSTLDMRVTTTVTTETTTTTTTGSGSKTETTVETHYDITQDDLSHKGSFSKPEQSDTSDKTTGITTSTEVFRKIGFATPKLVISQNAGLKVLQGAQIRMQSFIDSLTNYIHQSALEVRGSLELEGSITGTESTSGTQADFAMEVDSTGSVTGSGTLTDAGVHYVGGENHQDQLKLSGGYLELDGSGIKELSLTGDAAVYYSDGVSIGSVSCSKSNDHAPTFYGKSYTNKLQITGSISGDYNISSGYVFAGGNFVNDDLSSYIKTSENSPIQTLRFNGGDEVTVAGHPSYAYKNQIQHDVGGNAAGHQWVSGTFEYPYFTFSDLQLEIGSNCNLFEVFTYNQGKMDVQIVASKSDTLTADPSQIFLIRGITLQAYSINEYNSSNITPGTSNTGSGILGGSGAGSLTGGTGSSILGGNRKPAGSNPGNTENPVDPEQPEGPGDPVDPEQPEGPGNPVDPEQPEGPGGPGDTGGGTTEGGNTEGGTTEGGNTEGGNTGSNEHNPGSAGNNHHADDHNDVIVKVTGSGTDYTLSAFYDGIPLQELGDSIPVTMRAQLDPGWNKEHLFAVFLDENGEPVAVRVRYNAETGELEFEAPMLGDFRLVCFGWEGMDLESPEFLEALKKVLG